MVLRHTFLPYKCTSQISSPSPPPPLFFHYSTSFSNISLSHCIHIYIHLYVPVSSTNYVTNKTYICVFIYVTYIYIYIYMLSSVAFSLTFLLFCYPDWYLIKTILIYVFFNQVEYSYCIYPNQVDAHDWVSYFSPSVLCLASHLTRFQVGFYSLPYTGTSFLGIS